MSFPTPWRFIPPEEIQDAQGNIVTENDGGRSFVNIDLGDLVNRVNAGADALKALEQATRGMSIAPATTRDRDSGYEITVPERIQRHGQTIMTTSYAPELTAYLRGKTE